MLCDGRDTHLYVLIPVFVPIMCQKRVQVYHGARPRAVHTHVHSATKRQLYVYVYIYHIFIYKVVVSSAVRLERSAYTKKSSHILQA